MCSRFNFLIGQATSAPFATAGTLNSTNRSPNTPLAHWWLRAPPHWVLHPTSSVQATDGTLQRLRAACSSTLWWHQRALRWEACQLCRRRRSLLGIVSRRSLHRRSARSRGVACCEHNKRTSHKMQAESPIFYSRGGEYAAHKYEYRSTYLPEWRRRCSRRASTGRVGVPVCSTWPQTARSRRHWEDSRSLWGTARKRFLSSCLTPLKSTPLTYFSCLWK